MNFSHERRGTRKLTHYRAARGAILLDGEVIVRQRAEPFGEYVRFLSAVTEQPTFDARTRALRLRQRSLPRYCNNAVKSAGLMRRASRPCQSPHKRATKPMN